MQAIEPCKLVRLGTLISDLRAIEVEVSVKDAKDELNEVFELLGIFGLQRTINKTANLSNDIRDQLRGIEGITVNDEEPKTSNYAIGTDLANAFEKFAEQVEAELKRECEDRKDARILIPEMNLVELNRLTETEEVITVEFDREVFGWLPTVAKDDFKEAVRCLSCGMSTGAAGLMLRATEASLGHFYRWYFKAEPFEKSKWQSLRNSPERQDQLLPEALMWKDMTKELRGAFLNQHDPDLYHELEILRAYYRNPTQHAARRFDKGEAENLWKNCRIAVNRMHKRIQIEDAVLKICMPWPCDLDTLFAIHLINDNAGPIGDLEFVDPNDESADHQGGYVVNCARGQFDRSQLKEPKSASWMLIKHFCLPEGGDFQKLLNHVNAAVVHKSNHKGNPPKGLWAYVDWYMKNKVRAGSSQETIEKLLLDKLLPLVKSYIGDQNPADQATLRDFIRKLDLPQQD